MAASLLKTWLKRAHHRCFHAGVRIGEDSYVDRRATVHRSVVIGARSQIFPSVIQAGSVLGSDVLISAGVRLGHTRLGDDVGLEPHVEIYGSTLADHIRVQTKSLLTSVHLGRHSYVARETILNEVRIGSFASIGPQCLLGAGEHPVDFVSTSPVFYSDRGQCGPAFAATPTFAERRPITLGHDVWLGARVFVRDGVTIGDGAIVAAGTVVTKDVPPYAIVGGVPAKIIRLRFSEAVIARLLALQWWHWPAPRLRAAQPLMAQPDIARFLAWAEQPFPVASPP